MNRWNGRGGTRALMNDERNDLSQRYAAIVARAAALLAEQQRPIFVRSVEGRLRDVPNLTAENVAAACYFVLNECFGIAKRGRI